MPDEGSGRNKSLDLATIPPAGSDSRLAWQVTTDDVQAGASAATGVSQTPQGDEAPEPRSLPNRLVITWAKDDLPRVWGRSLPDEEEGLTVDKPHRVAPQDAAGMLLEPTSGILRWRSRSTSSFDYDSGGNSSRFGFSFAAGPLQTSNMEESRSHGREIQGSEARGPDLAAASIRPPQAADLTPEEREGRMLAEFSEFAGDHPDRAGPFAEKVREIADRHRPPDTRRVLGMADATRITKLSEPRIKQLARAGRLGEKSGKRWAFSEAELVRLVNSVRRPGRPGGKAGGNAE